MPATITADLETSDEEDFWIYCSLGLTFRRRHWRHVCFKAGPERPDVRKHPMYWSMGAVNSYFLVVKVGHC
jgi:hypothetical protein